MAGFSLLQFLLRALRGETLSYCLQEERFNMEDTESTEAPEPELDGPAPYRV